MAKGRHRAARELPVSPKTAVTVGAVALTGLALAGAVEAQSATAATPGSVWNRVAACESGSRWHIDTGNGYYGGLQFSRSTWSGYHGGKYAGQANRASRAEQIEVARRVLASQGPHAWPVCGPRAGLSRSSGAATHASLPSEHSLRSGPASRSHHHAKAHQHAKSHQHAKAHGGSRHSTAHVRVYKVRSGDTLSSIAQRFGVDGGWHALWQHNRARVHNPNVIRTGQDLRIPR